MAGESIMGIARDLTVSVLDKLSTAGSVEVYGGRIGRLYRTLLKEVEAGRRETLATRGGRHSLLPGGLPSSARRSSGRRQRKGLTIDNILLDKSLQTRVRFTLHFAVVI